MSKSRFFEEIKSAVIEREVEDVYNKGINLYFPDVNITHPFACDGFLDTKTTNGKILKLIIEYKFDELLSSKTGRAKVLIQVVFYMKQFELNGMILPNVCMVGDVNECFVIHTNALLKYLDEDVNWSVAPSNAHFKYPDLVLKIANDDEINPFVFDIDENFSFKDVAQKITDLADNVQRYVHVTEHNVATIYDYFCRNVIKNVKKIKSHDLVGIFMGVITNGDEYYQHPTKKNILVTPLGNIDINGDGFKSFFSYFQRNYTPQEKNNLTAIADRLIEDTDRRNNGDFWTPTLFVDYAHKMISEQLGEDWKDKYVVWDNCYDKDTEFLSQNGWKKISEWNENDLVMQFNQDRRGNFVKPIRYIKQEYTDDWVILKGSQIDVKCTKGHNFVVFNDKKGRNQEFHKIPAVQLYNKSLLVHNLHLNIPKTFDYNGNLTIDENILRLAIAINADGCYKPKTTLSNHKNRTHRNTRFTDADTSNRDCYVVSVKKVRKAERMRTLLRNAGIDYKYNEYNDYKNFTFHFPFDAKHFPKEWYNLSNESKAIIVDEIFNWDGTVQKMKYEGERKSERKTYSTSKKDDADFISFVFSSMGYGVNHREDNRTSQTNYLLTITSIKNAKISNPNNTFAIEKNDDGMCYCFEVPSGMLVVRRNGKIYIGSNCCGAKNLTRDYKFKELYCSTLFDSELKIGERYNKEANSFQFDFLNDSLDKLPQGLKDALEQNKPIVFFLNPPYATASNRNETSKEGVNDTLIRQQMREDKLGAGAENLQHQFLYRICKIKEKYNLTNCHIAIFSNPIYLSGDKARFFLEYFCANFEFKGGILFKASEFSNVSSKWGITFNIWKNGKTADLHNFIHKLVKNDSANIVEFGSKNIYNVWNKTKGTEWTKEPVKHLKTEDVPNFTSGITIKNTNTRGRNFSNNIGFFWHGGYNNVQGSPQGTGIFSSTCSNGHGHGINEDNFMRCTALFSARKLIEDNWMNDKDEYLAPNEQHEKYNEFVNNGVIYSLFHSASNQSSLRQVEYKGKLWDIKNEFFWMSKEEIMDLANEYNMDEIYEDAKTSNERYVYKYIQEHKEEFSQEALDVLNKAIELTKKSFKYRQLFAEDHVDYQVERCWDAGFYQLKAIWKEYMKDDFEEFKKLYKVLSDKMRPMVYELGFLK